MSEPDYKKILLNLIGSLCLCDHMGDVSGDMSEALKQAGYQIEWDEFGDLMQELHKIGATTLYGTSLGDD